MYDEQHDQRFIALALEEARRALEHDDVPVGAILVDDTTGNILARDHNRREELGDPTAHAEVLVLRAAGAERGHWRLGGTTLYVTLEPCVMCAGALVSARVDGLVFGAWDKRWGAAETIYQLTDDPKLNHRMPVRSGVLEPECRGLLQDFFRARRGGDKGQAC